MPDRQDTPTKLTDFVELTNFPEGALLSGRYRIISKCGQGGMGVVYKVEQIFVHKQLALKTINRKDFGDTEVRRFQHEARAASAVDHPNVIAVHDFGLLDDGTPFFAMDFIDGITLGQMISAAGHLTIETAIAIFIPVCFGLAAAHKQGIVHRDLKPSNIMTVKDAKLGDEGSVKVVDFGIAKLTQHEGGEIQALTRTGEIFGSPMYMSPEQCKGGNVDHRSDIYSLGCVLFEALIGTTPFIGGNALSTMLQHLSEPPPTLKEASLGKEFPAALEHIVAKMLSKNQDDRYQNLGLVAHELSRVGSDDSAQLFAREYARQTKARGKSDIVSLPLPLLVTIWVLTAISFGTLGYLSYHFTSVGNHQQTAQTVASLSDPTDPLKANEVTSQVMEMVSKKDPVASDKAVKTALSKPGPGGRASIRFVYIDKMQMKAIADTPWVISLALNYCHFDNASLSVFQKRGDFVELIANDSNFNDVGCDAISHCSGVKIVEADRTSITDTGLFKLARMKHLEKLEISTTNITKQGLGTLAKMSSLQFLRIRSIPGLTDETLASLKGSNVRSLELDDNQHVDDGAINHLCAMRELKNISLNKTMVSEKGIAQLLLKDGDRLLSIGNCPKIDTEAIARLRLQFPNAQIKTPDAEK